MKRRSLPALCAALAALGALRLKSLSFLGCAISDLTPIRKMPLEKIDLSGTRVADLSPLIGCSDHTPAVQVFAVFSFSFGGPSAADTEIPASARGH